MKGRFSANLACFMVDWVIINKVCSILSRRLPHEEEIGDLQGECVTLANQGEILRSMGEMQQAHAKFERALLLNRQEYDAHLECVVLHNLGLLYQNEKNYQQAWNYYQQALKLAQSLQERANAGIILTNMGMLLFDQGQLQESLALLLPALQIRQSLQDRTASSLVLFLETLEQMMGQEAFVQVAAGGFGTRGGGAGDGGWVTTSSKSIYTGQFVISHFR